MAEGGHVVPQGIGHRAVACAAVMKVHLHQRGIDVVMAMDHTHQVTDLWQEVNPTEEQRSKRIGAIVGFLLKIPVTPPPPKKR